MSTAVKYSPEVRERAVRMELEHQDSYGSQWAAISSIGPLRQAARQATATARPSVRALLVTVWVLAGVAVGHAADYPVHNPVTDGAELIRKAVPNALQGHVIATLNDPLQEVVQGSRLATNKFIGDLDLMNTGLDVVEPVRFTFSEPRIGFTVPAAIRVYFSRRIETFTGDRFYAEEMDDLRVAAIVVTKLPIYADPEAAYQEAQAWEAKLQELGYQIAESSAFGLETRDSFLAKAHKKYDFGIGSDYPSFTVAALRKGHVGININIKRSPHPERDGPEAHGFNIGIAISDLRVHDL